MKNKPKLKILKVQHRKQNLNNKIIFPLSLQLQQAQQLDLKPGKYRNNNKFDFDSSKYNII